MRTSGKKGKQSPFIKWAAVLVRLLRSKTPFLSNHMGAAIGFAVILIVFGIFLPDVLLALQEFFLTLIQKATFFLDALDIPNN